MSTRLDLPPPPDLLDERDGGGSDWVQLWVAENDIDAHLLVGRLHQEGIETRSVKDRSSPVWLFGGSNPWAPVAIWVRRFQFTDSRIVLAELSFQGPDAVPAQAPSGSGSMALAWWAAALALGVFFTGIGLMRSMEHLERCGLTLVCEDSP